MAAKTSDFVSLLQSLFILLLFVSSQVGVSEARRFQRNKLSLDCVTFPPPPPPIARPPIFLPPSKSPKGKGP
ncbi:hypothetical protein AALP_AA6G138400 [Arabis alpina]|uniref:Transmembrane protein n=1 Tax=Arabis alpina TaxID=50452 RepID=A0A087GP31_ARAAL|nr:hypothetical protein AALP_AA6G138400 [Arabis alpina]